MFALTRNRDSLRCEPVAGALQRLPLLELEEVGLLLRVREEDLAVGAGGPVRLERRLETLSALRVLAVRKKVEQVSKGALPGIAGQGDVARVGRHLRVSLCIALEHLLHVPCLAIEEVGDLMGPAFEADDQSFPVDGHGRSQQSTVDSRQSGPRARQPMGINRYDNELVTT